MSVYEEVAAKVVEKSLNGSAGNSMHVFDQMNNYLLKKNEKQMLRIQVMLACFTVSLLFILLMTVCFSSTAKGSLLYDLFLTGS